MDLGLTLELNLVTRGLVRGHISFFTKNVHYYMKWIGRAEIEIPRIKIGQKQ